MGFHFACLCELQLGRQSKNRCLYESYFNNLMLRHKYHQIHKHI